MEPCKDSQANLERSLHLLAQHLHLQGLQVQLALVNLHLLADLADLVAQEAQEL